MNENVSKKLEELRKMKALAEQAEASKSDDKDGLVVMATAGAVNKKFSNKKPNKKVVGKLTELTKTTKDKDGKTVQVKADSKKAKSLFKFGRVGQKKKVGGSKLKKIVVTGMIAVALAAGFTIYNKSRQEYQAVNTQDTAAVATINNVQANGGWEAKVNTTDTLYNQALAQGIEIYNKTGQQISGEDLIKMYIGSNSNYVSAQFLAELGLSDTVTSVDITDAVQNYSAINKEASDAGVVIDQFILSKTADDNAVEATTKANTKYATTGNFDEAKAEIDKYDMATYSSITNAGQTYIANFAYNGQKDFATIVLGSSNAACQNMHEGESKYDNYLNGIRVSMDTKFAAAQDKTVIVTEDMNYLNIAAKLDKELTAHVEKNPYTGKTMVELKNELLKNTINKDAKEIKPEESLDEALKQNPNAKVNEEKKTVNLNPNKVVDKTKETSTPKVEYKDNTGKTTTKEEVTKENVKTGETTIINGKEYTKAEDGTFVEVNKNAGKGVQKQSETVTKTEEKVVETKTETEVKVETKTEKQQLEEVKEQIQASQKVETTEKFYDLEGNEYNSEQELLDAISGKTK